MRPVNKGDSPLSEDYSNYQEAFPEMLSRLGPYCSYCERIIHTNLAIEHIQPKDGQHGHPDLIGNWDNFLLGCVNCNSTKGAKKVELANILLPDRDNTGFAYLYTEDGTVTAVTTARSVKSMAEKLLTITGLDKPISEVHDSNGELVAVDRVSQRMQTWLLAFRYRQMLGNTVRAQHREDIMQAIVDLALTRGHFSIWMKVFQDELLMRYKLIENFPGTATNCYDPNTTVEVSPRPKNHLEASGKI